MLAGLLTYSPRLQPSHVLLGKTQWHSCFFVAALVFLMSIQQRDCSGFSPDSLFTSWDAKLAFSWWPKSGAKIQTFSRILYTLLEYFCFMSLDCCIIVSCMLWKLLFYVWNSNENVTIYTLFLEIYLCFVTFRSLWCKKCYKFFSDSMFTTFRKRLTNKKDADMSPKMKPDKIPWAPKSK